MGSSECLIKSINVGYSSLSFRSEMVEGEDSEGKDVWAEVLLTCTGTRASIFRACEQMQGLKLRVLAGV